uniref:Alternative protein LAMB1 n=1 Tax=Homo sapiens TaxID=9606 RepID=L8E7Q3_HUMAN|nr:alternative protein LAMB1 [Homo sapiens]
MQFMIWWFEEIASAMVMPANVPLWMDSMKKWKEWFTDTACAGITPRA